MPLSDRILHRQAEALVEIVSEVNAGVSRGHPADATLAAIYRRERQFGSRDRRLFSDTVFSCFRWKGWLEPVIRQNPRAAIALAHVLDAAECHPAIRHLAEAAGLAADRLEPLGALAITDKAAALARLLPGQAADSPPLSLSHLVPAWVMDTVAPQPDCALAEYHERLLTAFQIPPPTWLRLRPSSAANILDTLRQAGITPAPHGLLTDAVSVPRGANLQGLAPRLKGGLEVQDLASQAIGHICAPVPGESWWDACAGSGGKTLHLADLLGPTGRILATDIRPAILEELHRRASTSGLTPVIRTQLWHGARQPPPAGDFDGVLLDAPCSGMGTWPRNPDARWRLDPSRIATLAGLQRELLRACAQRVRPGGRLIYVTCTLTRAENAGVLEDFLETHRGFALAPFVNPLTGARTPGSLAIHPWDGPCNGMFAARLVRTSPG